MKISSSILLSLTLACAACAQEATTWRLLPEARVDSSGIFLPQLVQLVVPSSASSSASVAAASSAVLPQIRLASAPSPGQTASFSRSQITELVQNNYSGLIVSNWSGATQVRVSRRTRQFTDSDMTELLTATLQRESVRDRGELELHLMKPWAAIPVPDEPLTLKYTDLPASGVSANFMINCELWTGSERIGTWPLTATAKVWRDIPLAHSALARGQLLKDADITLERRDVLVLRDAWSNFPTSDDSLELTENIAQGLPVLNRSVHARPLIHRGRIVEGLYQDGGLIISLKVEAMEDGLLGQIVRVRNPKTKHEIYGKVQNEQTVLISL